MIAPLAKGDYEDLLAAGLPATLEDFDRLNCIALRLQCGRETTAANHPRVGWAGDVALHQPTCAALEWYVSNVEPSNLDRHMKDACWYFALAHGRIGGAFDGLCRAAQIVTAVNEWMTTLPCTWEEIVRAARFAASGYDDAVPAKTPSQQAEDARMTPGEVAERALDNLSAKITNTAAVTGIPPRELALETPSRLDALVRALGEFHHRGDFGPDEARLRADYDMTFREIRRRLLAERNAKEEAAHG